MTTRFPVIAAALAALSLSNPVLAQDNIVKTGLIRYETHSKTNGINGIGIPPGADAETGDADTLLLTYERAITPNVGVELVIGIPPKIKAKGTGSVAFLGEVLSARNVAPTLLVNYHFGASGDTFRPYIGAGVNYTRFTDIKTTLPGTSVEMSDSTGLVVQAGLDYAINKQWGMFGSIARVDVKSKLVATGATVLTTTIDFRPITYSLGVSYRF